MISDRTSNRNRRVLHVTCTQCGGTPGFTNLVVSKYGDTIQLDPHTAGCCVIRLAEDEARALREILIEWVC